MDENWSDKEMKENIQLLRDQVSNIQINFEQDKKYGDYQLDVKQVLL